MTRGRCGSLFLHRVTLHSLHLAGFPGAQGAEHGDYSLGRTETDRKITGEPWSSALGPKNTTNENTVRSERRDVRKNSLTEPELLEMSGYQALACLQSSMR
jgi:hypothetical protein